MTDCRFTLQNLTVAPDRGGPGPVALVRWPVTPQRHPRMKKPDPLMRVRLLVMSENIVGGPDGT